MKMFDNNFTILEKGLDAYSTRAKTIANNIANINTPNYKRQDIQFEEILAEALEEKPARLEGKITKKGHMAINPIPSIDTLKENIITEDTTTMRNDGNNVDVEKEMAEEAKNNIRYQTAISRTSSGFNLLKSVIKGR